MTSLAGRTLATIRRRALCRPGTRVVAGVSGGSDSVALALVLAELARAGHVVLEGLAHFNHGLRGAEAVADEQFVTALGERLGLEVVVGRGQVAAVAARPGRSLEEAAREARYAFLEEARQALGADLVAVGHTRDDQAETVLLRLLRGAGPRGMAAIRPRRGTVIRPLIDLRRDALRDYLVARGEQWRVDASNDDTSRRRNRIRHQVMPALVAAEGPALVEVLARTADIAASDEEFLRQHAEEAWRRVVVSLGPPLQLNPAALAQEPDALASRVLMRAIAHVAGRTPSFAQVTSARRWLERGVPGRLALSAAVAELSVAQGVLITRGPDTRLSASGPRFAAWQHTLTVPGEVAVPEAGGCLKARIDGGPAEPVSATSVRVAHAVVGNRLVVRSWQPGDRVRPGGDFGRKKVQDLFVDRKVPRADRHRVPIVAAPDGRIVWIAGHAVGREFRATSATKSVVVLSFEPLGGR